VCNHGLSLLSCLGDRIGGFFFSSVRILTSYVYHVQYQLVFFVFLVLKEQSLRNLVYEVRVFLNL